MLQFHPTAQTNKTKTTMRGYPSPITSILLLPLLLVALILAPSPASANTEKLIFTVNHSPPDTTTTTTTAHTLNEKVDQQYHGIPHPSKWYTASNFMETNNNNNKSKNKLHQRSIRQQLRRYIFATCH
jgi:hypothetical protein